MTLNDEDIEAVAIRVVQLLARREPERPTGRGTPKLVDAATLAQMLGVSRATVYAKAEELGVVRLGSGKRAAMRFDPANVLEASADSKGVRPAPKRRPTRRRRSTSQEAKNNLLPIRGGRETPNRALRS